MLALTDKAFHCCINVLCSAGGRHVNMLENDRMRRVISNDTINLKYLRKIHGRTHIVLFLFFFFFRKYDSTASITTSSSEESAMLRSRADEKSADINRSCDMKYRPTKIDQLLSADNIGRLLSVVCHRSKVLYVCSMISYYSSPYQAYQVYVHTNSVYKDANSKLQTYGCLPLCSQLRLMSFRY